MAAEERVDRAPGGLDPSRVEALTPHVDAWARSRAGLRLSKPRAYESASAGASRRGGTDLGRKAEEEEEQYRRRDGAHPMTWR